MRAVLVAGVVIAGAAHADDGPSLHDGDKPALTRGADETMLHLDPVPLPYLAGLGAAEDTHEQTINIGKGSWVELQGTQWSNVLDVPQRGWMAGVRAAHDFGWFQVSASAFVHNIDTRYGTGTYVDVGVTIGKAKRFSRWRTAWIALTLGWRQWQGTEAPPGGEPRESAAVTLGIGFTFK